MVIALALVLNF